jgi:acetyl-CoA synthetase
LYIWADYEQLNACFTKFLGNQFACTLLVLDYPPHEGADQTNWKIAEQALIDAVRTTGQTAVVVASLPETLPTDVRQRLAAAGIAPMQGIEDCIFAVMVAAKIGAARANLANISAVLTHTELHGEAQSLDEVASKAALAEHGVTIPAGKVCAASETVAAAAAIAYPVVLKAVSSELAHKSEVGAVKVGLADAAAVRDATAAMAENFDRFLVEAMAGPMVAELIVGVSRDSSFGLSLLVGTGGTMVELLDDTASLLLPASRDDIRTAVESLKVARIINGYRGGLVGNMDAVLDAIEAIAGFAVANEGRLLELDVNPLLVTPDAAIAVDAFIRLSVPAAEA